MILLGRNSWATKGGEACEKSSPREMVPNLNHGQPFLSTELIPVVVKVRWLSLTLASKSCTVSSPVESMTATSELLQFKASFCGFGRTVYLCPEQDAHVHKTA